jgi:hypothetical protein
LPTPEPDPSLVPVTSAGPCSAAGPEPVHAGVAPDSGPRRLFLLAIAAGVLSGLVSWLVWEVVAGYFAPRGQTVTILGTDQVIVTMEARERAGVLGGAAGAAILGAALALSLGVAGGLARRRAREGLRAGLAVAGLGMMAGFAAAWLLLPVFYRYASPISGDLILPLLTQGGVWTLVGAVGGLALGLGLGSLGLALRAGIGGLLGGLVGAIAFEALGAVAFPNDETDQPVSKTWVTRLILRLLVAVLAAAGAALAVRDGSRAKRTREADRPPDGDGGSPR